MRSLLLAVALTVLSTGSGVAQDKKKDSKVELKLTAPEKVAFMRPDVIGGKTAAFKVKINVDNKGTQAQKFSLSKLDLQILDENGKAINDQNCVIDKVDPKTDAVAVAAGKAQEVERGVSFYAFVPMKDIKYTIVLKAFGQETKTTFVVDRP
jgi:hypothetical protein